MINTTPKPGEGWRHYSGTLYLILALGRDESGKVVVIYTEYTTTPLHSIKLQHIGSIFTSIYTRELGSFLQTLEDHSPRFKFDRGPQR